MESKVAATAKALNISEEQVRDVLAFEASQRGTWASTVNSIITHEDGSRHWGSQDCEQCL